MEKARATGAGHGERGAGVPETEMRGQEKQRLKTQWQSKL